MITARFIHLLVNVYLCRFGGVHQSAGSCAENHFAYLRKKVLLGSRAEREITDIILTNYACYLIAQNSDPRKTEIQQLEQQLDAYQRQKKGLMQKLLTGEIRVKISRETN